MTVMLLEKVLDLKSTDEILELLKCELSYLKKTYHVSKIGLFGSFAREEQSIDSDIDLLVEFSVPVGFFTLIELEDYLTDRLEHEVEIVTPRALKPLIKHSVIRDAVYVN